MLAMLLSAAVLFAAADTSNVAGSVPSAEHAKPKNKDMELVCWQETPAGTHFSKRVCTTRVERERMERQGQEAVGQHPRAGPAAGFAH